jgi:hypothetical protein
LWEVRRENFRENLIFLRIVKKGYYFKGFHKSVLFQVFNELVAVTGYPLASLFNDRQGIFLTFCGDE